LKDLPSLLPLVAFEAAARHASFKLAAEELCITPSAVSHRIRALEGQLGMALFHRFNRQLALTDAGVTYFKSVRDAFGSIARSTKTLTTPGAVETLVIHSPPSLASKWLIPRLSQFIALHPDIRVRLNATEQKVNFHRRPVDVAICHVTPEDPDLHVEVLLSEQFLPLCAPKYRLDFPRELAGMPLIETERNPVTWAMWLESHRVTNVDLRTALRIDPSAMALQAAVEGLGVVLESDLLARQEIASRQLVCPFPTDSIQPISRNYHVVYAASRAREPSIAAFAVWLRSLVAAQL
jgi:LysR family glycine cleavage system transcriptional activator